MAFLEIKNVKMVGLSAAVPRNILLSDRVDSQSYTVEQFIATTGVKQKRYSLDYTSSDLCFYAAEKLISDLNWQKQDIDAIIFVSQTADYIFPASSCILQDRLQLSEECYALDIPLGCSGWVYGLSSIAALMSTGTIKKALLMAGDAREISICSHDPLFGYAGTVTALEYEEGNEGFKFHFGTDGSGYDAIIIPDGGARNGFTEKSLVLSEIEPGVNKHNLQLRINGMDVFSFAITKAPQSIKKLAGKFTINLEDIDYFVFHQANKMMNEKIKNNLKLPAEKVPYSIEEFGNTSSASIPLTIVTALKEKIKNRKTKIIACGFGVGLSWGSVAFSLDNTVISELVEI